MNKEEGVHLVGKLREKYGNDRECLWGRLSD